MTAPTTSTTLLRDIASSAENARWGEFFSRYEPMMKAYLQSRFPGLDADDIVQETLVALTKVLPQYHYNKEEHGYFHNYLTGIVRRKALDVLAKQNRADDLVKAIKDGNVSDESAAEKEYKDWRESIYEIVLQELLSDETVHDQTKQIFVRTQIDGEPAEKVMASLGVTRNTIDLANSRCRSRLHDRIKALKNL